MLREILTKKEILKNCKIFRMLAARAEKEHMSFHTPGHKINGFDITELSYSDNLSCPKGCILEAERDVAEILGAEKSFILTDGSTCVTPKSAQGDMDDDAPVVSSRRERPQLEAIDDNQLPF